MTVRPTPERLAEIRARLEVATPGPWERVLVGKRHEIMSGASGRHLAYLRRWEDAAFVVHALEDVALLLAEIDALVVDVREERAAGMRWRDRLVDVEALFTTGEMRAARLRQTSSEWDVPPMSDSYERDHHGLTDANLCGRCWAPVHAGPCVNAGSEFEQQVRTELRRIVTEAHGPTFHNASFDLLAIRVADAAYRGAERAIAPWAAALLDGDRQIVQEVVLAALRGETS